MGFFKVLKAAITKEKEAPRLISVESITPGRQHAWCESSHGMLRKPLSAIPAGLMNEYRNQAVGI